MSHNKTVRALEQKLEERDEAFSQLLENFKKLKAEYEKQHYKMKEMEKQIDVLTNSLQTANDSEEDYSDPEELDQNPTENMDTTEAPTLTQKKRKEPSPIDDSPPPTKKVIVDQRYNDNFPTLPPKTPNPSISLNMPHSFKNPPPPQKHHTTPDTTPKASAASSKRENYVPPIILRDSNLWNHLSLHLKKNKISYERAKSTEEGIKIHPTTADDYRKIIKHLDEKKYPYHTFQLPQDKHLHVVIRGIPTSYTPEEVKEELEHQNYHPQAVFRMTKRDKQPIPLILTLIPKTEHHIFQITNIFGLSVRMESLKNTSKQNQCRNCQKFGHGQQMCKAAPKCLKCGEDHHTTTCQKPRDIPAVCANCRGAHPANYRGCPKHPNNIKKTTSSKNPETEQQNRNRSFAEVVNKNKIWDQQAPPTTAKHQQPTQEQTPNITDAILSIQNFAAQFSQMAMQLSRAFAPLVSPPKI